MMKTFGMTLRFAVGIGAFVLIASGLSSCSSSTVKGFGEDLQRLGNKIERKADQRRYQRSAPPINSTQPTAPSSQGYHY